ncbi:MAG: hypothetical protein M0Q42_00475 [Xanthomonadales bacterium]|nr:hypothetical protein [Xanthomonadales bacterium]
MPSAIDVDGLRLTPPAAWQVFTKYDEWAFYRRHFQSFAGGKKAVDAMGVSDGGTLWLIEVKDYRRNRRSKPSRIEHEIAGKVADSLSGLAVARVRATGSEQQMAESGLRCSAIRVVLQLAQPVNPSRLFPQVVDPADVSIKLKRAVRAVDPHPMAVVGDISSARLPWKTS